MKPLHRLKRRLAAELELHFTPQDGSWLNMAEIELSVLHKQCLNRQISDQPTLCQEVAAWVQDPNASHAIVNWRLTTDDARIRLKHLYPSVQSW